MLNLSDFGDSAIAREATPSKLRKAEINSIQNLMGMDNEILCASDCFSIEWLASHEGEYFWPRLHHHWIAISSGLLVIGNFHRETIGHDYYKRDKNLKRWYSIIHHRSGYISLPSVRTSEITDHTVYSLNSISQVSLDDNGVDAYTFSEGSTFQWRYVLDSNGIESRAHLAGYNRWSASNGTTPIAIKRLVFMSDSNSQPDLFSFNTELIQIGVLIQDSANAYRSGQDSKSAQFQSSPETQNHSNSIDIHALEKLSELFNSGALTAEEFSNAKKKLLG
jgi:hypothetical protein